MEDVKCRSGKIRYPSRAKARKVLRSNLAKRAEKDAYWCRHCRAWHITSQRPQFRNGVRVRRSA